MGSERSIEVKWYVIRWFEHGTTEENAWYVAVSLSDGLSRLSRNPNEIKFFARECDATEHTGRLSANGQFTIIEVEFK